MASLAGKWLLALVSGAARETEPCGATQSPSLGKGRGPEGSSIDPWFFPGNSRKKGGEGIAIPTGGEIEAQ